MMNKENWTRSVRELLIRAFSEFMCRQVSIKIGKPDYWTKDVTWILNKIPVCMNPKEIKTTFKDREKTLSEALCEASKSQDRVLYAKNEVANYYPKLIKKIGKLNFTADVEFRKMTKEFLPQYEEFLPKDYTD